MAEVAQNNTIPSTDNIQLIVNSLQSQSKLAQQMATSTLNLSKSVSAFSKVDPKIFRNSSKLLNDLSAPLATTLTNMTSISQSFVLSIQSIDMKTLNDEKLKTQFAETIGSISNIVKSVMSITKTDTSELSKGAKNFKKIETSLTSTLDIVTQIADRLIQWTKSQEGYNEQLKAITDVLLGYDIKGDITKEFDKDTGKQISQKEGQSNHKAGFLEVISKVVEVSGLLNGIKVVNPIKFFMKLDYTLWTFRQTYQKLETFGKILDPVTVNSVYQTTQYLADILIVLPKQFEDMANMFKKIGTVRAIKQTENGAKVLLGRDWQIKASKAEYTGWNSGILGALVSLQFIVERNKIDASKITPFSNFCNKLYTTLLKLAFSLSIVGMTGKLMKAGAIIMFGVHRENGTAAKRGIIDVIVEGLHTLTLHKDDIQQAAKPLLLISASIALLSLAILALVATGAIVIRNAISFIIVPLALLTIIGMFWILSRPFVINMVRRANKELVYMAATIALLGLTVLALALAGHFISTNIKAILVPILLLTILIGAFFLLSLAKPVINVGAKQILAIAGTIALLALTAVLIVLLGQFIKTNWDSVLQIGVMLGFLVAAFIGVGFAGNMIKQGAKAMLWIALCVAILALVAVVLVWISPQLQANWDGILAIAVMLGVLVGAVIGVSYAAKQIQEAKAAMILMLACIVILVTAIWALLEITEGRSAENFFTVIIMVGLMLFTITYIAGEMEVLGKMDLKTLGIGTLALGIIVGIAYLMSLVMKNLSEAADVDFLKLMGVVGIMLAIQLIIAAEIIALGLAVMGPQAAIFAAGAACVATIGGIALMLASATRNLAEAYNAMQETGASQEELEEAVNTPINTVLSIFGTLSKVNLISLLKARAKMVPIVGIMSDIGDIAKILQKIASLNMPDPDKGYDEKGRPLGYKQMTSEDFLNASLNAAGLLLFFTTLFGDKKQVLHVLGGSIELSPVDLDSIQGSVFLGMIKMKAIKNIVSTVGKMADILKDLSSMKIPVEYDNNGNVKKWKNMESKEFLDASLNVAGLLHFFAALFGDGDYELNILGDSVTLTAVDLGSINTSIYWGMIKMKAIREIVSTVGNMATVLQNISSLRIPMKYNDKGEPTDWITMGATEFLVAGGTVGTLISFYCALFGDDVVTLTVGTEQFTITPVSLDKIKTSISRQKKKFEAIGEIVSSVGTMVDIIHSLSTLKVPTGFNEKGEPTGYTKLGKDHFKAAMGHIDTILSFFTDIWADKRTDPITKKEIDNPLKEKIKSIDKSTIKAANNMLEIMKPMNETIKEIIQIDRDTGDLDPEAFTAKFASINCVIADMVSPLIGQEVNVEGAKVLQNNLTKVNELMKQINTVDVNKLKWAASMLHSIRKTSESIRGNFEGLAKTINGQLITALQKIEETIKKIEEEGINVNTSVTVNGGGSGEGNGVATSSNADGTSPKPVEVKDMSSLNVELRNLHTILGNINDRLKDCTVDKGGGSKSKFAVQGF